MISNLLSIDDLLPEQIESILDAADSFADVGRRKIKKVPTLRGRTICNLFFEPSTRTRISFELAAKRLSADVINFQADGKSSVAKGESFKDTALTIQAMGVDAIVVRHWSSGAPSRLAQWVQPKVINAGDGCHEHPTQALLDLYTLRRHFKSLEGLHVGIVGDIAYSRVARSNIKALTKMGARVTVAAPATLLAPAVGSWGVEVVTDLDAVLPKLDAVYVLRLQTERREDNLIPSLREYAALWGLDRRRAGLLAPGALIMHPGPLNNGVEIAADVAAGPMSAIGDQVTNGVAVRMSLLYLMLGEPPGETSIDE